MTRNDFAHITLKELAHRASKALNDNNIKAVLVGGACVSIYTHNKYQSFDLDYISPDLTKNIEKVLNKMGFNKRGKFRHYEHNACPYCIEFPPGPIALGRELPITKFNTIHSITLLTATDCVKDRLAAFYHWHDEQSLQQALLVAHSQKINLLEIKNWSINEKSEEKFNRFVSLFKK
ncbi:MAG: hypothetical protein ABII23_06390 [bacterium]